MNRFMGIIFRLLPNLSDDIQQHLENDAKLHLETSRLLLEEATAVTEVYNEITNEKKALEDSVR